MITSVAPEELASPRERFFSNVIDMLLLAPVAVFFIRFIGLLGIPLFITFGLVYHWYWWMRFTGQTPGKKIMNIRIVKADGREMTDVDTLVRYCASWISFITLGLGWLSLRGDEQLQGWHDKVASTVVVKNYSPSFGD
jgi:uncharacterized RDD family membrane protein YckC